MVQCFYCSSCGQWGRRFKHGCRKCKIGQFKHSKCGRWVTAQYGFCPICYKDRLQRLLSGIVPKKRRVPVPSTGNREIETVEENLCQCVLKKYNLKINYPSTWTRFSNTNPPNPHTKVFFQSPKEDLTDLVRESVGVCLDDTIGEMTLDTFIEENITTMRQDDNNKIFKLIESKPTTLSGIPAHQIIYSTNSNQWKFLLVATIKNKVAYWIMYIAEPNKFVKFLPSVEQMISSFEFLAQ